MATWTEQWTDLTPPGTTFVDKDWYTDHSVPKGAIVFVIYWCINTAYNCGLTMRPNGGSMTNRYVMVDESQGTDNHDYELQYCETDANGINEWRTWSANGDVVLCGYLEGVTHTCLQNQWYQSATGWQDKDLSGYGVPGNTTVGVDCMTDYDGIIYNVGIRNNGSSEPRQLSIDPYDFYRHGFVLFAQADGSSIIETYGNNTTYCFFRLLGYFSGTKFYDDMNSADPTSSGVWQDLLLGSVCPQGALTGWLVLNMDTAKHLAGVREDGSSLNRYCYHRDYDHGSRFGCGMVVKAGDDVNRTVEVYSADYAETEHWYTGYFEFGWAHKIMGVSAPGKVMGVSSSNIKKIQGVQ